MSQTTSDHDRRVNAGCRGSLLAAHCNVPLPVPALDVVPAVPSAALAVRRGALALALLQPVREPQALQLEERVEDSRDVFPPATVSLDESEPDSHVELRLRAVLVWELRSHVVPVWESQQRAASVSELH
jgi:hypothetical protein